jgi:arsenite-transporting ATPase
MRILLYTGKGGVGKTSVSAATALRCAELGYRTVVVSTDSAHSLADSFDMPLGPEPTPITENLWGQELDVLYQMDKYWGDVQEYMASLFAWRGVEDIIADEMAILPGMEELASLLQVVYLYDSSQYEAIIIDCAPTGATLQLLTLPEIGRWYIEKVLPLERKAFALSSPFLRAVTDMPLPDVQVFDVLEQLLNSLRRMHKLLTDRELTSARLVLNPEKMVIKESQRARTYLSLYGYATDAVICNRLIPPQADGSYFAEWQAIQGRYRDMVQEAFAPLPILDVPFFDREVVGVDMLRQMAQALFGDQDPTDALYAGDEQHIQKTDEGYQLYIPLPMANGKELQLTRSSFDELVVRIGNHKHVQSLPHTLASMEVQGAKHENGTLVITFGRVRESRVS